VGKTQLVLKAAVEIQEEFKECSVFWVPAITIASFEGAYRDIGRRLGIDGIDDEKKDVMTPVKTALSQPSAGSWLMVVDNADDAEMLYTAGILGQVTASRDLLTIFHQA